MDARKIYNLCFTNQDLAAKMSAKVKSSKFIIGKTLIICEASRDGVYFEQRQGGVTISTIYVNRNGINPVRFM